MVALDIPRHPRGVLALADHAIESGLERDRGLFLVEKIAGGDRALGY